MPLSGYREGSGLIIPQEISIEPPKPGKSALLVEVPPGFFMRWRIIHWIISVDTTSAAFRWWYINVVDPSGNDYGQIIPGQAAVGGGGAPTNSPIHELLDATSPVFFDAIFQGGAGVQPAWDYSGLSAVWWPDSFKFFLDATNILPTDNFESVVGMVELIEAEDSTIATPEGVGSQNALAYLLHNP